MRIPTPASRDERRTPRRSPSSWRARRWAGVAVVVAIGATLLVGDVEWPWGPGGRGDQGRSRDVSAPAGDAGEEEALIVTGDATVAQILRETGIHTSAAEEELGLSRTRFGITLDAIEAKWGITVEDVQAFVDSHTAGTD